MGLSARPGVGIPEGCPLATARPSRTPATLSPGVEASRFLPYATGTGTSTAREHCSCGCAFQGQPFGAHFLFHLKINPASESTSMGIFYILS